MNWYAQNIAMLHGWVFTYFSIFFFQLVSLSWPVVMHGSFYRSHVSLSWPVAIHGSFYRSPVTLSWPVAMHGSLSIVVQLPHSVVRRPLTSTQKLPSKTLQNSVCSTCRERGIKGFFMTPTPKKINFGVKSVKMM